MKHFTLNLRALCAVVFLSVAVGLSAADYPTLADLYGRYTFNGEMTLVEDPEGEGSVEPVSRTGYTMVVLPGAGENEVRILGFFGYGGGLTATYDEEKGTLFCHQNAFFLCTAMDFISGAGLMAYVDAGMGDEGPLYLDLTYNVAKTEDGIVITAAEGLTAVAMSAIGAAEWTYAAGYTLTKSDVNVPVSSVTGTYAFEGRDVVSTTVDATENFNLTVTEEADGKLGLSGLFGIDEKISADYMQNGGIILLPHDFTYSNGWFMGDNMDFGVMLQEAEPYLLVDASGHITTSSSFILNGEPDEAMEGMMTSFSFYGGQGKKGGDAVRTVAAGDVKVKACGDAIEVMAPQAAAIRLYNAQGALVGAAEAASARFANLQSGIYVVKVAGSAVKVVVK